MSALLNELRQSLRLLARRPAFTILCVGTLALGMGATTALFSAVYHILLSPLPFRDADRLVHIVAMRPGSPMQISPTRLEVETWRSAATAFEHIEPYDLHELRINAGADAELIQGGVLSSRLPGMLGVRPVAGRLFTAAEDDNRDAVALIGESFARVRYGTAANALGATLRLNDRSTTIAGVVPDKLAALEGFSVRPDIWLPIGRDSSTTHEVSVIGRLRSGVTAEAARVQLAAISARLVAEGRLDGDDGLAPQVLRPQDRVEPALRAALPVLFAGVSLVLLIACFNVAGLLFVQVAGRDGELAIRAALGASRARLLRHLALDSLLIALAGGALAVLIATWATDLIHRVRPDNLAALDAAQLDAPALLFTFAMTVLTALLLGTAPVFGSLRGDLQQLIARGRGSSARASAAHFRSTLVIAEVALALVLLIGATLLVRTVMNLQRRDLGFAPQRILTFSLALSSDRYQEQNARDAFRRSLLESVRALPGVEAVAIGSGVPPGFGVLGGELEIDGRTLDPADRLSNVAGVLVGSDYFHVLGIPIQRGRALTDSPADAGAIVVNEAMARRYWPNGDALGQRLRMSKTAPFRTIVGIAGNVAVWGPRTELDDAQVYVLSRNSFGFERLIVRTAGDPLLHVPALRRAISQIDPNLSLRNVETIPQKLAKSMARDRFALQLMLGFAALAVLLTAVGLYGVISSMVAQRTREIGIRVALGATPQSILALVLGHGSRLALTGVAAGVLIATAAARFLTTLLHGVPPHDPASFALASVLLGGVCLIAIYWPVRKALRVDPVTTLKAQ
jgi:putative ABC transport system permease protein